MICSRQARSSAKRSKNSRTENSGFAEGFLAMSPLSKRPRVGQGDNGVQLSYNTPIWLDNSRLGSKEERVEDIFDVDRLIDALIDREGGYVNHPADKGGPTCFGITEAVARAHGYRGAMRDLPRDEAVGIY